MRIREKQGFKYGWWVPAAVMMAVIFLFSAQDDLESSAVSLGFTQQVITQVTEWIEPEITEAQRTEIILYWEPIIRKLAHFTEYAVLAALAAAAFYRVHGFRGIRWMISAWLFATGYAVIDECHQIFVPGRAGRLLDIGIDSAGALTGLVILFGIYSLYQNRRKKEEV